MWKRAVGAAFLFATSSAFASDPRPGTATSACEPADAGLAKELRDLSERVSSLERKVEKLEAKRPTREEPARAKIARERRAEFLQHVWTDG